MKRSIAKTLIVSWCWLPVLWTAGCGEPRESEDTAASTAITVYSGRNESLIGPILERFTAARGVEVKVRYGDTAEMAATLMEEGPGTPAHVFISQDAGALGALSQAGLLKPLPQELLSRVAPTFASTRGDWVGLSGRARVVVYNTDTVQPEDLPQSFADVTAPRYRGKFGVAPTNGSFQAHLAVYHVVHGAEALKTWLDGVAANEPATFPNNRTIVEAVMNGEIEWGLVNHYYLWRALQETPEAPARNFFMNEGEASGFINVAGAGLLQDDPNALALVSYLLDEEAQTYFAQETYEYPLADSVPPSVDLQPLAELKTPKVDFGQVSAVLEETLSMISTSGLLP